MDAPLPFILILIVGVVAGRVLWVRAKGPDQQTIDRNVRELPSPTAGLPTLVRSYRGDQTAATRMYQADAARMGRLGYRPMTVQWTPGQYSPAAFLVAVILCFLLIGILIFAYMVLVKPPGSLNVTYHLDQAGAGVGWYGGPTPTASAVPVQGMAPGLADRLAQLASARDAGLISLAEHDAKRSELLSSF